MSIPHGSRCILFRADCVVPCNRNYEAEKTEGGTLTGSEARFRYSSCDLVAVRLAQIQFTWAAKHQDLASIKDIIVSRTHRVSFPIAHIYICLLELLASLSFTFVIRFLILFFSLNGPAADATDAPQP
jgi:hypothetical protein